MKNFIAGLAISSAVLVGAPAANASTYDVNFNFLAFDTSANLEGTVFVTGTIITTCDSCAINQNDVTSWSFNWSGALSGSASGLAANVSNAASPLSAGNGLITFNLSSTNTVFFTDATDSTSQALFGPNFGGFCLSAGCLKFQNATFGEAVGQFLGPPLTIATEEGPIATPLPGTLPLFATGLGALGLIGWRRKRNAS